MQTLQDFFQDDDSERYGPDTNEARLTIQFWYGLQKPDESLNLSALKLHTLPPIPDSVQTLYCSNPYMVYIKHLPPRLQQLWVARSQVRRLPTLPHTLSHLDISHTLIRTLPNIPTSLKLLYADNSSLEKMDRLYTGIEVLLLNNTSLKALPHLPESLKQLSIEHTHIDVLPPVPSRLKFLKLTDTPIKILPRLPVTLTTLTVVNCPNLHIKRSEYLHLHGHAIPESIPDYAERWLDWYDEQDRAKRYKTRHANIELELIETLWDPKRFLKDNYVPGIYE